jgi:UDP-3-O-[3-hydroxymyristoyl] glucosamine N-acyltransferase
MPETPSGYLAKLALPGFPVWASIPGCSPQWRLVLSWKKGRAHVSATTLRQLAELVHGQVHGDGDLVINAARTLQEAQAGDITFLENDKNSHLLHTCRASAVVAPKSVAANGVALVYVADPLTAFIAIHRHLHAVAEPGPRGVDAKAAVDPTARIGEAPSIFPFAVIGEGTIIGARCRIHSGVSIGRRCRLGDDVTIYPNAVLYDDTVVGNRVTIHANSVIGADGFGYRLVNGKHAKVPQLGLVELGDDVEIGACTTIDRGTFMATRVGAGTKIDNLVQVGHNCQVGKHNLFVSQMGIAGSSTTGDYVVIAGQAGIVDHVHLGDQAIIGAKAGVTKDVAAGQRVLGAPATPERDQKRILMTMERLPEMRKDLKKIKEHLGLADEAA